MEEIIVDGVSCGDCACKSCIYCALMHNSDILDKINHTLNNFLKLEAGRTRGETL